MIVLPDTSGIYCMFWEQDREKYYIGCSISIKNRIKNHLSDLNRNAHANYKLQNNYNKYGKPIVEVLELCNSDEIFDKEVQYISEFDSFNSGLNLTTGANGRCYGEDNGFAKYSYDTYKNILFAIATSNDSYSTIAKTLDVTIDTVKHIGNLSTHRYLQNEFPEMCNAIRKRSLNRDNSAKSKGIIYPTLLSPEGMEYIVDNIHAFSEQHGLQYQNLHKVLTGSRNSHKGWKLK